MKIFAEAVEESIYDEDDDILAEMMAEEMAEREELTQLEAEMRELEALQEQRRRQQEQQKRNQQQRKRNGMNVNPTPDYADIDEELRRSENEIRESRRAEEEALAAQQEKEANDRRAAEREALFAAEMERAADDEARRKALMKQKRRDARVVRQILRDSAEGQHYAVLGMVPGLCRWVGEIRVGSWLHFCGRGKDRVKRAFRDGAKKVHPDKNRDGKAEEAFRKLEESANFLGDDDRRRDYDAMLRLKRRERVQRFISTWIAAWKGVGEVVGKMKIILGPLFLPVVTLMSVII